MKRPIGGLAAVIVAAGVGGAGWWMWHWIQETKARQAALSAQLSDAQAHLTQLHEEHQTLQATHEALERTQTEAEAELRRLNVTSSLLLTQLQAAAKDKEAATEQLAQVSHDYEQLTQERNALRGQFDALGRRKDDDAAKLKDLEAKLGALNEAQAAAGQEREALSQKLNEDRLQTDQLAERISDVSLAYDRLLAAQAATPSGRKLLQNAQAADRPRSLSSTEKRRQARVHQDLGEAYWVMELYQKAAEELEQSLEYRNDPEVHGQLTMLYSHFLHDSVKASHHLSNAKGARILSSIPTERPYQLPRSSTRLVQEYLHDQ